MPSHSISHAIVSLKQQGSSDYMKSPPPLDAAALAAKAREKEEAEEQDIRYYRWKRNVPLLYDAFINHNIEWSSLSAQWGGVVEQPDVALVEPKVEEGSEVDDELAQWRRKYTMPHTLYFSSRSAGGPAAGQEAANQLLVAQVPLLYRPQRSRSWNLSRFNEERSSADILVTKRIIHPGEVNRIRVSSSEPHLVATHSDSPLVYVWDALKQAESESAAMSAAVGISVAGITAAPNTPDLTLTGHTDKAEYALDFSKISRKIVSGGRDCRVLLWAFSDASSTTALARESSSSSAASSSRSSKRQRLYTPSGQAAGPSPLLKPRNVFVGHEKTVEDVRCVYETFSLLFIFVFQFIMTALAAYFSVNVIIILLLLFDFSNSSKNMGFSDFTQQVITSAAPWATIAC